jgi:hypothetical protein
MKNLASFQNIHQNSSIVVCGCGESLNGFTSPERFITIGVNDVGRKFQPNYLVVVNPRQQFSSDRFSYVETSQAEYIFTQLDLNLRHKNVVKFKLGTLGGTDFFNPNCLDYTNNSPYIALNLAILMGAKRIGLIGVDFTDNHFFAKSGKHSLSPQFETINTQYINLAKAAESAGIEIYNLSKISRLTAFPKISIDEFAEFSAVAPEKNGSLKIVSYATTPIAGVPAILVRCINARTDISARCVWASNDYGNGVSFTGDVEWNRSPQTAEELLVGADVVIVHNGKVEKNHEKLFKNKAVITMAHNYLWNVDERFVNKGFPGLVVGQYQATLAEFKNWAVVPNPIPLWEKEYTPQHKPDKLQICYTPSGKHEQYPPDHKLYWHSKGYQTTMRILDKLATAFPVDLEVIRTWQITHDESLAMKMRSQIVIDECVTGSYHRNSLEGLSGGCVVVNGLGILPSVKDILCICSESNEIPFVSARLENLESILTGLIESGTEKLFETGSKNRRWLEQHWNFARQWQRFWLPAIEKALHTVNPKIILDLSGNKNITSNFLPIEAMENSRNNQFKKGACVVIPHGGKNRLPQLRTTLANLRQCSDVGEIIVVEMDKNPTAVEVARKFADKYFFLERNDLFERGKTLNIGSYFSECEYILWMDNDLLISHDFISRSIDEITAKNLDFLVPFSEVKYLSFADTEKVMQGTLNPDQCSPIKTYTNTMTDGGIGLVRNEFFRKFGGIPKGFQGWGGEDNAWMHKAYLLGKVGRTKASQPAFHLYHALSGGNGGNAHITANPQYQNNLQTLAKIHKISGKDEFLQEFSPEKLTLCDQVRTVLFISDSPENIEFTILNELFASDFKTISSVAAKKYLLENADKNRLDAVVLLDDKTGEKFVSEDFFVPFLKKTIVVSETDQTKFQDVFAVLTASQINNANVWNFTDEVKNNAAKFAVLLAQPLSLLLNNREHIVKSAMQTDKTGNANDLPVWLYWEGERPEWIEACIKTVFKHAPHAQLLTPETFDELWDIDRDINPVNLHVAHRADFIRAFLLYRYGGIWIDCDCVLTKPLDSLLEIFADYDFAAHRERGGYFGNEFMIAKRESKIAEAFYTRIAKTLRTKRQFGWCEIGCVPLTDIISKAGVPFLEIECDLIQPICWSNVEPYFTIATVAEHQSVFNSEAFCYMLSNLTVNKYVAENPHKNLFAEDSFFSFLIRKSLFDKEISVQTSSNCLSSKTKTYQTLEFYLETITKLSPRKILDADAGFGSSAVLLRDYFETSNNKKDWRISIEALIESKAESTEFLDKVYNRVHFGSIENLTGNFKEKHDLTILGDCLTQKGLENSLTLSDYVLLNVNRPKKRSPADGNNEDLFGFIANNSDKIAAFQNFGSSISFLLSDCDPKKIRSKNKNAETNQDRIRVHRESIFGTGFSFEATWEIRRSLPLLLTFLGINSMLDAKCGDFRWLKYNDLRLKNYIGIDLSGDVTEQNNSLFADVNKKFMTADITKDFLPGCDLILLRDCFVHYCFEDIFAALQNFTLSGAEYLLTTTFPKTKVNTDIKTGDWRTLNLQLPPFNFPEPAKLLNERCMEGNGKFADKSLGLWKISSISSIIGHISFKKSLENLRYNFASDKKNSKVKKKIDV